jgi:putative hydrolase of the HAD superfamily
MIDAVLFDLDETLLDRTTSLHAFLGDQFERYAGSLGDVSLDKWRDRFLTLDQRGHTHKTLVYPAILREFGGNVATQHELFADYSSRCADFAKPFDGMAETLAEIRALGLRIGIVTNGETEFQTKYIDALKLKPLVDAILISQHEGLRKPDPVLFHRAADRLLVSAKRCLFVGDNPVADILGAAATGMQTAWFRGSTDWPVDQPPNPGAAINRLETILHLLVPRS